MVGKKNFVITAEVVQGYLHCPRKGFFLAFTPDLKLLAICLKIFVSSVN